MKHPYVEILLIEDNSADAELTLRALRKNNISNHIHHLKDGAEAIEFLFGNDVLKDHLGAPPPKLILLDLKMPRVDGIELLHKLKSTASTRLIPVVILTSSREDPDIARCYALGVNSYIVKPVDFNDFHKAISDLGFYWAILNQPHQ